jgi:hypothetical protein
MFIGGFLVNLAAWETPLPDTTDEGGDVPGVRHAVHDENHTVFRSAYACPPRQQWSNVALLEMLARAAPPDVPADAVAGLAGPFEESLHRAASVLSTPSAVLAGHNESTAPLMTTIVTLRARGAVAAASAAAVDRPALAAPPPPKQQMTSQGYLLYFIFLLLFFI